MAGNVKFSFYGETFYFPADTDYWLDDDCVQSFDGLGALNIVSCTSTGKLDAFGSTTFLVQLKHLSPMSVNYENNYVTIDGKPALADFACDVSAVTGSVNSTCAVSLNSQANTPDHVYCSNRGICDFVTGQCACLSEFKNSNCDMYDYSVRELQTSLDSDVLVLVNTKETFSGNILSLESQFAGTADFNFVSITDADRDDDYPIFTIDGLGNVNMNYGGLVIAGLDGGGGMTIGSGGLVIKDGGLTIKAGGNALA
jgi:hypothetical protein